jgi:predicted CoA-substrate-specific enzyme activase
MTEEFRVGVDIGSRTTKIVILKSRSIIQADIFDTVPNPLPEIRRHLAPWAGAPVAATGYGRRLVGSELAAAVVTEIKACALGAHELFPDCRLVIDVGGQDAKAIQVRPDGGFEDFELNDRCSAGTGRFLEVMARALGYDLDEFCQEAKQADRPAALSSMCTVFAESEVVSLLASGGDRRRIARGIYNAIVDRVYPLAARFDLSGRIVLAGGVALSRCLVQLLGEKLGRPVTVPPNPQILSALGAALTNSEKPKGG